MLRTCMATECLTDVFIRLGKTPTKENMHTLCAMACSTPEIFLAPAMGAYKCYMVGDIVNMWCKFNDTQCYSPYAELARKVLQNYDVTTFQDADTLKAILDALTDKVAQIRKILQDDGFPDLG